eukprot:TCONS_00020466-protein
MDGGDNGVSGTDESVIKEITQSGQDNRLSRSEKTDQNTTEIMENDQVDGLQYFEPSSTQEIDMNTSEGSIYYEVDTTLENDESANIESANQEADGVYPQIEEVKRIEVDLHPRSDGSAEIDIFEEEIETLRPQSDKPETESKNDENDSSSGPVSPKDNYQHPRYDQFDKLTRKYFKYIHRYHLGDTVPIYFRSQFQMQMRSLGANCLTIGLFGQAGSGKSAFLNSLYSSMNGSYIEYSAERRSTGDALEGATNERVELRLTETISVLDNRATDFSKNSIKEIVKQLEGFRENGSIVPDHWKIGFKQKFKDCFESCCKWKLFRNRVQTPVIINSLAQDFNQLHYKALISAITLISGSSPIIVLTHLDTLKDPQHLNQRIQEFEQLNCPRVYKVANYTRTQNEPNKKTDANMIEVLFNSCLVGDQVIQHLLKKTNKSCCCN